MRKFAGATTPCQSNAAATRLMRSPPAAKKRRRPAAPPARATPSGSRSGKLRPRPAGLERMRARAARARHARARAPPRTDRLPRRPMRSAIAVAGRCGSRLSRSSRRKPSIDARPAQPEQRHRRRHATARQNTNRPMARPSGGSDQPQPSQDSARNSPTAVASDASAGHSRSQNRLPRARVSARVSSTVALPRARLLRLARSSRPKLLRSSGSSPENLRNQHLNTQANVRQATQASCMPPTYSQAGMRSSAINWSTSRRGRTSGPFGAFRPALPAPARGYCRCRPAPRRRRRPS